MKTATQLTIQTSTVLKKSLLAILEVLTVKPRQLLVFPTLSEEIDVAFSANTLTIDLQGTTEHSHAIILYRQSFESVVFIVLWCPARPI